MDTATKHNKQHWQTNKPSQIQLLCSGINFLVCSGTLILSRKKTTNKRNEQKINLSTGHFLCHRGMWPMEKKDREKLFSSQIHYISTIYICTFEYLSVQARLDAQHALNLSWHCLNGVLNQKKKLSTFDTTAREKERERKRKKTERKIINSENGRKRTHSKVFSSSLFYEV